MFLCPIALNTAFLSQMVKIYLSEGLSQGFQLILRIHLLAQSYTTMNRMWVRFFVSHSKSGDNQKYNSLAQSGNDCDLYKVL